MTPANLHDSQIDMSILGIICYKDNCYLESEYKSINGIMDRAVSNHKVPMKSIRRNLRIFCIRSMVKHLCAFFKRIFHFSHIMVTTVWGVRVKTYFSIICYNLMRARTLDRAA